MIYLAISNLALVALAVFLILENRHQVSVIESVARSGSPDLSTMTGLVADLCQRIQAPQAAVAQHAGAMSTDAPQHVPMDDDAAYFESKEQLASRLEAMRLEAMHVGA
jgi:hypothetical protein